MYGGARRIVITGMGLISPLGHSLEQFWQGLVHAQSAIGPITAFDAEGLNFEVRIAAEVKDFNPEMWMPAKQARRSARFTQFACAASKQAIVDAGLQLPEEDRTRVSVELGTALGGDAVIEQQMKVFWLEGWRKISAPAGPNVMANVAAFQVAADYDLHGPCHTPVASCASSLMSLGEASRRIACGLVDVALAGGSEACVVGSTIGTFSVLRALSRYNDDPPAACRPFDASRNGTVIGEGAGVLILESAEHAARRGAKIYAEIVGYGVSQDAFHVVAPEPEGRWAALAMQAALTEAKLNPDQINYVVAHGTGTEYNDVAETAALKRVFGNDPASVPPVSSNKAVLGHTLGAAGAFSTMAASLAIQNELVPPTANLHTPDPRCDLDYVPLVARPANLDYVMVNAFGFGGQNASLIIKRWDQPG